MKNVISILLLFCTMLLSAQKLVKPEKAEPKPVMDTYHGMELEDPYRYMEDIKDPEVVNWMKANAKYAEAVLEAIPKRDEMIEKIKEMDSRRAASISNLNITDNDDYYYLKTRPQDEQGKLFYRKGYEGEEKLLLDPLKYKTDKAEYSISNILPSHSGEKVAVILAPDGSENGELIVLNKNGEQLGETLNLVFFANWLPDDESLYYSKFNSADISDTKRQMNMQAYKHEIGNKQDKDKAVFSSQINKDLNIKEEEIPILMYDKNMDKVIGAVVTVDKSVKLYMNNADLTDNWKQLTAPEDKVTWLETTDDAIYYQTFKDAPNYKIVKSSVDKPEYKNARTFIPEPEMGPISGVTLTSDGVYYTVKSNGVETKLFIKSYANDVARKLELPLTAGSAGITSKGPKYSDLWVYITGWTTPGKRYRYLPEEDRFINEPMSSEAEFPELEDLEVKEVMVSSHDGVKVPVSIIHRKDIKMDGSTPATMYGYGSYGSSTGPFFSPLMLIQTHYGGMFVVPHVRGGGELGDAWHRAGQKLNKPNTWKDAIATAEYLIDEGYTKPEKLSFFGGSAGGILVGRAVTERPDLFASVAPLVGAMNTVRMEASPNGPVNAPEFGTVKDPEEFKGLLEMDSYHHLEDGTKYPAMLVTSGMNDPRVIAWEPAKFAARAQVVNASDNPILLLTDFDSGHGMGDMKSERFELFSNIFSFFFWQSGHPEFQPPSNLLD